jgi:hypothetical protein
MADAWLSGQRWEDEDIVLPRGRPLRDEDYFARSSYGTRSDSEADIFKATAPKWGKTYNYVPGWNTPSRGQPSYSDADDFLELALSRNYERMKEGE